MTELVFRADPYATRCDAAVVGAGEAAVTLDRTVFYPTGGGQPGDHGRLVLGDTMLEVVDTVRGDGESVVHCLATGAAVPEVGARLLAEIDWVRRHRLMRMHSALHLLCAAVGCA